MINIVYSEAYQDQAATRIRIIEPLDLLAKTNKFQSKSIESIIRKHMKNGTFDMNNPDFKQADILYLFITDINKTNFNQMGAIIDYFLQMGKPIVTNLDDHYFKIPDSITVKKEMEENAAIFKQLILFSRLILVTGAALKDEISKINPSVVPVPNMIDPSQYRFREGGNKRLCIGWSGLPSHFADLAIVIPAIKKILKTHPIEFTIFGLFNEDMKATVNQLQETGVKMEELNKKFPQGHFITEALKMSKLLEGVPYQHVPLVPYEKFPAMLSRINFDIGLCPLQDTLFNRCKSAIKFAQYAAVGTVTAASKVYPYTGECNFLVDNTTQDWYEKLMQLIEDEGLRQSILEQQYNYIMNNRVYKKGIAIYEALFNKIVV